MRYATSLALVLFLMIWAGCGKKDAKPADAGKGGAGESKKAEAPKEETPKDVAKGLIEHWKAKGNSENWFAEGGDKFWTKKAVAGWKVLLAEEKETMPVVKYEMKDEKVEGDKATVTASLTIKKGEEETLDFGFIMKKEDGKWKIWKCGKAGKEEDFEEMADAPKEE